MYAYTMLDAKRKKQNPTHAAAIGVHNKYCFDSRDLHAVQINACFCMVVDATAFNRFYSVVAFSMYNSYVYVPIYCVGTNNNNNNNVFVYVSYDSNNIFT